MLRSFSLYDTLSAKKHPLKLKGGNVVKIYVCGITVYDECHIGHARVAIFFDTVVRVLRHSGYHVEYVRNITDIDDKILSKAQSESVDFQTIAKRYIQSMHRDYEQLNILKPDTEPLATEYIEEITEFISTLIKDNYAYIADNNDVNFSIDAFKDYGKLSKRSQDDQIAGKRVAIDKHKKNPADFVLWKSAKPNEVKYPSPFGEGRPGWHIECSTMVHSCLGDQIDIHGGGHDLTFPHHENEIAQSKAYTGKALAQTWMHVGFVTIADEKMSKSLGNMISIKEALQNVSADVLRYYFLSTHYRSPIAYQQQSIDQARERLTKIQTALNYKIDKTGIKYDTADIEQPFWEAMSADFNSSVALGYLEEVANKIHVFMADGKPANAAQYINALNSMTNSLGLFPKSKEINIQDLLDKRNQARYNKDYTLADGIRKQLEGNNIIIEDGPNGTTWRKKI